MKRLFKILILTTFLFTVNLHAKENKPPDKLLASTAAAVSSENASLSGYVIDDKTGETIIGATVFVVGTKNGAYTNKNGFFSVTNIPEGEYTVRVSYIGYKKLEKQFKFKKHDSFRETFVLVPEAITSNEIEVTADREVEKRQISISKIDVPIANIKEIRIAGESDVFRAIQMLPGVLTSSQISSGLFVRGGSPDQNLVLLDGSSVYNPSHIFGFISTFNSDAIKDVELIKGGFPAEFGGRLSSVLNITQKDGNTKEFKGNAALGIISSKASLEGPIGNGSWFISGRRTYFDLISGPLDTDPLNPLPVFWFYDINAKLTQNIGKNDKFFLSGFSSQDNFEFNNSGVKGDLGVKNWLISSRWTHIFGDDLFSVFNLSRSTYINTFNVNMSGYKGVIDNSISDWTAKASLEWFASEKLTAKFGYEGILYEFKYYQNFTGNTDTIVSGSSGGALNLKLDDFNHSVFAQINYQISELWSVQAGLRGNYWRLCEHFTIEPRLAIRWQVNENIAVKGAYGRFNQNLRLASMQDFSFFDTWLATDRTVPISSAEHYILSLETIPGDGYNLNFDVYYKKMNNVNEINMTSMEGDKVKDVFFIGNAEAFGLEVFLQKKIGRLTGWFGYALGFIDSRFDSINNGKSFRPKYDRRHDMKLVLQYKLDDDWDFGASFVFQSGQSYTGATSRGQSKIPGQSWGRGIIFPSQRYGLRLPPSHQLNVNITYNFKSFGLPSKLSLDIYNVYNHRDILMRYYKMEGSETVVEDVKLIPIIPSLTYEISF
jgi:hypothetical protein